MRAKMALALTGLFTLGCTGMCSGLLDKVTGGSGSGGCPEGTHVSQGWPGEYPDPVLQVNAPTEVDARADVCDDSANLDCTVPPGLYHPWSDYAVAAYKTVSPVQVYVAEKDLAFKINGTKIAKGTEIRELAYVAEGQCEMELNGETFFDTCLADLGEPGFKALPMVAEGFSAQQYFSVQCAEGHTGWIHVNEGLRENSAFIGGELVGYGEVDPTPLADGSLPFDDKWTTRRKSAAHDLKIPEHEGPFWTIAISAGAPEDVSKEQAEELRGDGWPAHIAWLGDYGSAKNKEIWLVYVGPYASSDRTTVKKELSKVKAKVDKKAYGVTLGRAGQRKQIK